jgi:hypothetical protein
MNLHGIASGAIGSVNPHIPITIKISNGYTTDANYIQQPQYTTINTVGQIQPLSASDLKRLESLNIQSVDQKVFLSGNYEGIFRQLGKGGDILTFAYGNNTPQDYLVTTVLERWPEWCSLGVTMQVK